VKLYKFGEEILYWDYTQGFGGYKAVGITWQMLEATNGAALLGVYESARANAGTCRVWVSLFNVQTGDWDTNSAVMKQPTFDGFSDSFYGNFTLTFTKLGVHNQNYTGGNSPTFLGNYLYVYGDAEFSTNGFTE
jgi:hypothetical protein